VNKAHSSYMPYMLTNVHTIRNKREGPIV